MPLRMQAFPALIAASLLQPACAMRPMPSTCTLSGSLAALPGMDAPAICARFESALAAALGQPRAAPGLAVALTLHKRGAIEARLTRGGDDGGQSLPVIAVDALDRGLQAEDIDRLAHAVAQALDRAAATRPSQSAAQRTGT